MVVIYGFLAKDEHIFILHPGLYFEARLKAWIRNIVHQGAVEICQGLINENR